MRQRAFTVIAHWPLRSPLSLCSPTLLSGLGFWVLPVRAISGLSDKFLPCRIFVLGCTQSITSLTAMSSTTFTVRVETDVKKRLERLAKSTGRSRSFLAAEALNEYLDVNEWQVAGVRKAMGSVDRGKSIPHEQVKTW